MKTESGGQDAKPEPALHLASRLEEFQSGPTDREAQLSGELAGANRQLAILKALVAERDASIAALRSSWSWKITAPVRWVGSGAQYLRWLPTATKSMFAQSGGAAGLLSAVAAVVRKQGLRGLWIRTGVVLRNVAFERKRAGGSSKPDPWGKADGSDLEAAPLISVMLPAYNTPRQMLDAAIWSVRRQTYWRWELCAVDDASTQAHVREVLEFHAVQDERVRIAFRSENGNISAALNTALEMCRGDYLAVLDHDDLLHPMALYGIARTVSEHPEADYIYTDEDKVSADGTQFFGPFYKPDWSPEYFHSLMYTCHLGAFRASIAKAIGGYRTEFDGAQDLDFTLRFLLRGSNVMHVPRVLYHWRAWERSTARSIEAKPYAEMRARKALEEFLTASAERFTIGPGPRPGHHEVRFLPKGEPLVSIVIPTANEKIEIDGRTEWHLDEVIASIFEKSTYRHFEVIVVHNGNLRAEQVRSLESRPNVKLVHYRAAKFSLADKINIGCSLAKGGFLVILNDDIRVITGDWLQVMLGMAQREGVGAVGPKLLFPDGRIQHAGVVILGGCPGHAYYEWPKESEGYGLGAVVARNCIAVTGACLMVAKRIFDEVHGFNPRYPLNYNDVDFCLKLHELGYRSVYLPQAVLYHYEGVSKDGGRSVAPGELETFLADWGEKFGRDPYYNPNLSQYAAYQF